MATVLTEYTREKHKEAESSDFVKYMFTGTITKEHYIVYLQQMYHIYSTIEKSAERIDLFDGIPDLRRTDKIKQDLEEFGVEVGTPFQSTQRYIDHLKELSIADPKKIMAHVYVRHMGDLYGGKMIAKLIPGSGNAYKFEDSRQCIAGINSKISVDLAEEALIGFDYCIDLFNELKKELNI